MGALGAFLCVWPGYIIDHYGTAVATVYGLFLVNLGFGSILFLSASGSASPAVVQWLYFLEECGSAALFMTVFCLSIPAFPQEMAGMVGGVISGSYGVSSLIWQAVAHRFGFLGAGTFLDDTDLQGFLSTLLVSINAAGIVLSILVRRSKQPPKRRRTLRSMSNLASALSVSSFFVHVDLVDETPKGKPLLPIVPAKAEKLRDIVYNLDFFVILSLWGLVSSQFTAFFGYLSNVPAAFVNLQPAASYGAVAFNLNTIARVGIGMLNDILYRRFGRDAIVLALLVIHCAFIAFFGMYCWEAEQGNGAAPASFMYGGELIGVMAYAATSPIVSAHLKSSFVERRVGLVLGALLSFMGGMNLFFTKFFGPEPPRGLASPSPDDFLRPWASAAVCAISTLPVTVLWAVRTVRLGRRRPQLLAMVAVDSDSDGDGSPVA
mmetsp:Transcript_51676/g.136554  ORF Transcript_51676/g.136554 Transcript_51676/m.136554 type:complete len:434 (-) Transcript_51676:137-1438(-)